MDAVRIKILLLMFLVPAVIGALFLLPMNLVERFFLDARFYMASEILSGNDTSDEVAIVFMDARSEAAFGEPAGSAWRRYFPRVFEILNAAGTRTIAFDLEFLAQEEQWDEAFRRSVVEAGNVIAGE